MTKEQTQVRAFLTRISKVLGQERTSVLSDRQDKILSKAYRRLLDSKPLDKISDQEILGQYELVTEHLSPIAYEQR